MPSAMPRSMYSGSHPSTQMTTVGRAGFRYRLSLSSITSAITCPSRVFLGAPCPVAPLTAKLVSYPAHTEGDNCMSSNGKVALVTGGGSGIGKAAAVALAKEGFAAVIAGRRQDRLDEVAREIEGSGGQVLAVPTDVTDPGGVRNLFAKTKERFGRLDV